MQKTSQNIPFEIHLTTENVSSEYISYFTQICDHMNGKALIIELSRGNQTKQPMFSKKILLETATQAIKIAEDLKEKFASKNFSITRMKIETPAEFSDFVATENSANNYFEWHGKINIEEIKNLESICEKHKTHLSLNAVKNKDSLRFLTLREYDSKKIFIERVKFLIADLEKNGVNLLKEEYEYCFYDSNKNLDGGWLPR